MGLRIKPLCGVSRNATAKGKYLAFRLSRLRLSLLDENEMKSASEHQALAKLIILMKGMNEIANIS